MENMLSEQMGGISHCDSIRKMAMEAVKNETKKQLFSSYKFK